jgi:hypothetical protein
MENFNYKGYRANNILKSFGQLQDIMKGEGDRGGHVIGHTKSGKPIYQKLYAGGNTEYEGFTKEDHEDAAKLHDKKMRGYKGEIMTPSKKQHHSHLKASHKTAAEMMKNKED